MKCPACKSDLHEKNAGSMTLDVCYGGCGGIWFDSSELNRLTAKAAATLHTIWQAPVSAPKLNEPRECPRCPGLVLERKWFSDARKVEIDQCPTCGGVWLDAGEFSRIYKEIGVVRTAPPGWAQAMAEAAELVNRTLADDPRPRPSA